MRLLLLLLLSFLPLTAYAADDQAPVDTKRLMMVYNMCRGGGFAYELEPAYASQRNEACLTKAQQLVAETSKRAQESIVARAQLEAAKARTTPPATEDEMKKLMADYNMSMQRMFYVDYCIEQNASRYPHSTDGNCGYIDNRFWGSRWRQLAMYLTSTPALPGRPEGPGNAGVSNVFRIFYKLPAPAAAVIKDLSSSGFSCKPDHSACVLSNFLMYYRNGRMTAFGSRTISYNFTVSNGEITDMTGTLAGDMLR